jgi:hypothetical protein
MARSLIVTGNYFFTMWMFVQYGGMLTWHPLAIAVVSFVIMLLHVVVSYEPRPVTRSTK